MDSSLTARCPFHASATTKYEITFKEAPRQNIFQKIISDTTEFLSRFSLASIKNAWRIGTRNDLSETFALSWEEGSFISKCRTPKGTVYLTADTAVMKTILQNLRKNEEGIFLDHENTKLFIKGILNDIFPEDVKKIGIDKAADMIVITASSPFIKSLRAPLVNMLGVNCVTDFIPQMNVIADNILDALSDQERESCNGEKLAFEFAVTVISKFVTGYNTTRENYRFLAHSLNAFSKRMTRIVSQRPATKDENKEYQDALSIMRNVIESNMSLENRSPLLSELKALGWNDFQIRANLFFMYFAASETTASSVNYLLWQLGKPENKRYIEKIKDPSAGEQYLFKVAAEALRLHPPSFIEGRQFRHDTFLEITNDAGKLIKKIRLRAKHTVLCLTQVAALNPKQYQNPTQFNPDRFDSVPSLLPWYPFGTGNHVCPGQHLAHAELRVFVSRVLNKFSIEALSPKEQTQQKGFFTLRATAAQLKFTIS